MPKIKRKKAKDLIETFEKNKSQALNKIVKDLTKNSEYPHEKDARYSWYSLDDLESYISYLRASKQGINGVKIYLGQYDETNGPDPKYNGLTTTVFIPTKAKDTRTLRSLSNSDDDEVLDGNNEGQTGFPPGEGL